MQYPNMRDELREYLRVLMDRDVPNLDYAFHFFLDDTPLAKTPDAAIGVFLKNREEVAALQPVVAALKTIIKHYGPLEAGSKYVEAPEWSHVVETATIALRELA
jgi:hypothetical protein